MVTMMCQGREGKAFLMNGTVCAKSRRCEKAMTLSGNIELWVEHMVDERRVIKVYGGQTGKSWELC